MNRDDIARIIDPEAMGLAHKLGRPDLALTAEMQGRIEVARAKADAIAAQPQRSQEPVAWRWRAISWDNHWIYDPSKEWRELRQSDPTLEFQPLYADTRPVRPQSEPDTSQLHNTQGE